MVAICQPMQTLAIKARLTSYQAMNSNKSRRNQKTKDKKQSRAKITDTTKGLLA